MVTPSRVCELKYDMSIEKDKVNVTPSRVCELKFHGNAGRRNTSASHPHGCVS